MSTDQANQTPPTEPAVLQPPSSTELRRMFEEMIVRDLLGPANGPEEEIDEDRVRERYLVGMLAPPKAEVDAGLLDDLAVAGEDSAEEGSTDLNVVQSNTMQPSSLGLTFAVDGACAEIQVTARWGRYDRQHSEVLRDAKTDRPKLVWKRTPIEGVTSIPLHEGNIAPWVVTDEHPKVTVRGRVRRHDGDWLVTLFLVNQQDAPKQSKDAAYLFQPELVVEGPECGAVFRQRVSRSYDPDRMDLLTLQEIQGLDMLYRRQVEFAVGHGVGVHAEVSPADPERAVRITTRVVPAYEVPRQTPPTVEDNPDLASVTLDMATLAAAGDADLPGMLNPLAEAYARWITAEEAKVENPSERLETHRPAAEQAIGRCRDTLRRIRDGITLLGSDPQAAEAFRFANRAMHRQRIHSIFARDVRKRRRDAGDPLDEVDTAGNRTWYPFQLAFILLNLPSATQIHHPDRSEERDAIADLLWFPTGGGKTEAYLGLAAYTLALRRLQGTVEGRSGEHGVGVLMRYTLRLLTLQQFQRAATLICACETLRRENPERWGKAPFRIGLWVGMRTTPNTTRQAEESISESHGSWRGGGSGTPAQLTYCPWCGTAIDPGKHIYVEAGMSTRGRTVIYCGDALGRCPFSERHSRDEGIPALVVDEEIYRNPPSLLIATVDKFAQMPWKGAVQTLFGQVDGWCPRHGFRSPEIEDSNSHPRRGQLGAVKTVPHAPLRPPDLIIQDELHLISGPLGSLVGLYETAVDELCTWQVDGKRVRPKVIASTATIRRASDQISKLYLRRLHIFPPHGTDIRDNFFSRQREPSDATPGRRYLGICAIGRRYPAALIRAYVAVLGASQWLYERYDAATDPWMTLVGYFNSIRELGGTRRLVEDDISSRLRDADLRGLAKRRRPILEELTSRKSAEDIPRILDRLDVTFNRADEELRKEQKKSEGRTDMPLPYDVILATNMVSVGVDIDRLGQMVVAGQPKTTAEYIQATSRVGRRHPGLILTVYNWARPRDLSHYETFEHYHATFYKHVEALSVTPFAPRALDRGLSGILVSLVRLARMELNANHQAGALTRDHELLAWAVNAIIQRASLVMESNAVADDLQRMLADRRDEWLHQIERAVTSKLGYKEQRDGDTLGLLKHPARGRWERFTCLNSLRDVEDSVHLILDEALANRLGAEAARQDTMLDETGGDA